MKRIPDLRWSMVWGWLLFTLALAIWQFVFQMRLINNPSLLTSTDAGEKRFLRMVQYENVTLLLLLVAGGVGLFILLRQERLKSRVQSEFFATFTHEIKTSLGAIKLRAENLHNFKAGVPNKELGPWYREELLNDLNRIQLQLENSLFLAVGTEDQLVVEKLSLKDVITGLGPQLDLQVRLQKNCWLTVDRRALESIFRNLIYNSVMHGRAENLWIDVEVTTTKPSTVVLNVRDDGQGSPAETSARLGELFYRPSNTSGSGIGLYLVKSLTKRMGGQAEFSSGVAEPGGFAVQLQLPGSLNG